MKNSIRFNSCTCMQVCARHSKSVVLQLLALAGSASGERILQVADPKLLQSVDCKVPAQYDSGMSEVYIGLFEGSG